jgi:hypothetical protein
MKEYIDMIPILGLKELPVVHLWNRIEPRPRSTRNFDRALRAEVRDALWMLTRQWQMGEFEGDDAGSPVFAKLRMDTTRLTKYQAGAHDVQKFDEGIPLEAKVEQKDLPFFTFDPLAPLKQRANTLDLRVMMGRRWMKLLVKNGFGALKNYFLKQFSISTPDPQEEKDALICAHPEAWQQFSAFAGKMMDGGALYHFLKMGKHTLDLPNFPTSDDLAAIETQFVAWFDEQMFLQPNVINEDAWNPAKLEYSFSCAAPEKGAEKVLVADEYYHGHLDWYNLDIDNTRPTLGEIDSEPSPEAKIVNSFLPTPIVFEGMPNTRWWAFEDGKTNFSFIKPDKTEPAKLMLMEFGLVYANDWFLVPFTLPVGSIAALKGMSVTNVFGEHFWIEASGRGSDEDWRRWNMFTMNTRGNADIPSDNSILLLPATPNILEGDPLEEVVMIRDEMSNMVWGIETVVSLPSGQAVSGNEAATAVRTLIQKLRNIAPVSVAEPIEGDDSEKPKIHYDVMSVVPENWIPFIPTHVKDNNREIQLQRAAMPRIFENVFNPKPEKIRPRTNLLQQNLANGEAYFIHEEEVPRAGIQVYQSYQRTRWSNSKVFLWLGARKVTGKGEGSSGLGFDRILPNTAKG